MDTLTNDDSLVDTDNNIILVNLDADIDIYIRIHAAKCDSYSDLDTALSRYQHGRDLGMLRPMRNELSEHADVDHHN